jgi:hypothetical protein
MMGWRTAIAAGRRGIYFASRNRIAMRWGVPGMTMNNQLDPLIGGDAG